MTEQAKNPNGEGFTSFEPQLSELKERIEQRTSDVQARIEQRASNVQERIEQKASSVQVRLRKTQSRGVMSFFRAREKAATTIQKTADKLPSKLPENFKRELEALGDKLLASPVDDWDCYNAKTAIKACRELGLLDALRVRRYEAATKNRKTVLEALDGRISKYESGIAC